MLMERSDHLSMCVDWRFFAKRLISNHWQNWSFQYWSLYIVTRCPGVLQFPSSRYSIQICKHHQILFALIPVLQCSLEFTSTKSGQTRPFKFESMECTWALLLEGCKIKLGRHTLHVVNLRIALQSCTHIRRETTSRRRLALKAGWLRYYILLVFLLAWMPMFAHLLFVPNARRNEIASLCTYSPCYCAPSKP